MSLRRACYLVLLLGLLGTPACSILQPADSPSPSICDFMDAQMGGCDADLPEFTGEDCEAIAAEFGRFLDARTVAILEGPEGVDGEGRSVRLKQDMVLLSTLAGRRLDELELRGACEPGEFLRAVEAEFSDALREGVGMALYDGNPPATYDEWRDELLRTLAVIEVE